MGQGVVSPIAANFFRPSGPNYFFVASATGGAVTKAAFDAALAAAGTLRTPGPLSPFGEVDAQLSDGNSSYNALNLELKRRFSNNFQFLASYTWSHSIDDSSDLQTLLKPQDIETSALSVRTRFLTTSSLCFQRALTSPAEWRSLQGDRRFLADFTVAPIVEISSGRPLNILTGRCQWRFTEFPDRPSVAADGTYSFRQRHFDRESGSQ